MSKILGLALGISFLGKLLGPTSIDLLTSPFTAPGTLTFNGNGVNIALSGAKVSGDLHGTQTPSLTYNTSGAGRVVTIPFDTELTHLIDVVTTNKTDFFREPQHFTFMRETAVPALLKAHGRKSANLKVWSSASSRGRSKPIDRRSYRRRRQRFRLPGRGRVRNE